MSIRSAYKEVIRTTLRMERNQWLEFKKTVKSYGLTTCFVVRSLIADWMRSKERARDIRKRELHEWFVYDREFMGLIRIDEEGKYLIGNFSKMKLPTTKI